MKINNNLLVDDAAAAALRPFQNCPNQSTGVTPLYLLIHYTASDSLDSTLSWFMNSQAQASAHLVIGRAGEIVQMVRFDKKAWHAGVSSWGELTDINRWSIGIELVNAGRLQKRADGAWLNWAKRVVPSDEVTIAKHRNESVETGWHEYTEPQIAAALDVALLLQERFHFLDILGHDDVSPGRKVDPGPLFPLASFRSKVLGRH